MISAIAVSAVARLEGVDFVEEGSMVGFIGDNVALTFALTRILLLGLVAVLVSCSSVSVTTMPYVGAPRFPASDPAGVEILRTEPPRPHERLGEVEVDASTEPAPPIAEVEQKLRAEAAKMGADAVVVVHDRIQPVGAFVAGPWWGRDVDVITGRKLVGVAIKYR